MSKLIEKILKEGKVFGTLYHFTNFEGIVSILKQNKLISHSEFISKTKETLIGVSTSRSKFFEENEHVKTSIRIGLNADKISNRYKIRPFKSFISIEETEELILTGEKGLQNVKQYITGIRIEPDKEDHDWAIKIKLVLKRIKEANIPLDMDDMWYDWIDENPDMFKDYE